MYTTLYIVNENYDVAHTFRPGIRSGTQFYVVALPQWIHMKVKYLILFYRDRGYVEKNITLNSDRIIIQERNLKYKDINTELQRIEILKELCTL